MMVLLQLVLVWWMLSGYSSNAIFTEKYTKQSTSYMNMVAIRRINTSLLKCSLRCSQLSRKCSTNTQQNLNMSTGRCDEGKECVGFRFENSACALYIQQKQTLRAQVTTKEMYLKSGFMEIENRETKIIASTVNVFVLKESETTPSTSKNMSRETSPSTRHEESGGKRNTQTPTKPADTFGSQCSKNDQCDYDHGLCLSGKCSCRIGHSFDFNSNTCVTRCKQYGKAVSMYPNSAVGLCNLKQFTFIFSRGSCKRKCLKEKSFVCINADYSRPEFVCNLCDKTWAELNDTQRENGDSKGYTLIYRHCV